MTILGSIQNGLNGDYSLLAIKSVLDGFAALAFASTLGVGVLFSVIVILVFLQDWRAVLVPATTVPVTIVGAFAFLAVLGFSINFLTLFGLILAIGIVVDDAIIIVENAAHHIERGLNPGYTASNHERAPGYIDLGRIERLEPAGLGHHRGRRLRRGRGDGGHRCRYRARRSDYADAGRRRLHAQPQSDGGESRQGSA